MNETPAPPTTGEPVHEPDSTPEAAAPTLEAAEAAAEERPMRPFWILWGGQSLSLIGTQAVQFALIWWLTETTGSATILALATLVGLVPQVALGPVIGTLIDRWDRKRVMLAADGFVAVASLVLAGLFVTGSAGVPHVLALLFLRALGGAFHAPAMTASTSLMVPTEHLTRIQGINQSMQGLLAIVGAPLGALLFGVFSMAGVMMVDVFTALIAITPLIWTKVPRPPRSQNAEAGQSLWTETMDGLRYLAGRPGHRTLLVMSAAINALLVPAFSLLPLLVLERLQGGATQFGWLSSSFGVGMIAGGIALGVWGGFQRKIFTALAGMFALGIAVVAVGLTPMSGFWWAFVSMLGVGLIVPLVNAPIHAILQTTIAPDYQGRVFALVASLAQAVAPLGLVAAAPVAEVIGVGSGYLAGGIMCALMAVAGFLRPTLRNIEEGAAPPALAVDPGTA